MDNRIKAKLSKFLYNKKSEWYENVKKSEQKPIKDVLSDIRQCDNLYGFTFEEEGKNWEGAIVYTFKKSEETITISCGIYKGKKHKWSPHPTIFLEIGGVSSGHYIDNYPNLVYQYFEHSGEIDERIINFIEQNPDCLESKTSEDTGLEKSADRRSWQRVSELMGNVTEFDKILEKAVAGIVGIPSALKFSNFLKSNYGLNVKAIISNFAKHKTKLGKSPLHELSLLNDGMFRMVETEDNQEVVKKYIANIELYIKWLSETKRTEALAHWTTLYDSATYPKTKVAVLTYSPYIFQHIVEFINNIKL